MPTPGGKGAALQKLIQAGFPVPQFFVVPAAELESTDFHARVAADLPKAKFFAVRSSAAAEDSADKSYAGHFYTALGVPAERIAEEARNVRASYKGMDGGVIVQHFVASSRAGVLFTDAGQGLMAINANVGLCDSVVKGDPCDEYVLDAEGKTLSTKIDQNKTALMFDGSSIVEKKVDGQPSLSDLDLVRLHRLGTDIQKAMGGPQDVEWCFEGNELYVLQSRPITRQVFRSVEVYDSANIAESYAGIVLPLTQSFASRGYKVVYEGLLRSAGVPRSMLEKRRDVFDNLLGFWYGRVYYAMRNWYGMTAMMPFYSLNKRNLEGMITSNVTADAGVGVAIRPPWWLYPAFPFIVLWRLLRFGSSIRAFKSLVRSRLDAMARTDLGPLSLQDLKSMVERMDREILSQWYVTAQNDFMVMTYFALVKSIIGEERLLAALQFESISTKQIDALAAVSKAVHADDGLRAALERGDAHAFGERALQTEVGSLLDRYFATYGGRFANELKLESADLQEDFGRFGDLLAMYADGAPASAASAASAKAALPRNPIARLLVLRFRKYSMQREELRLLRSNAFGAMRRIFRRIGQLMADQGRIDALDDVFYLRLEELFDTIDHPKRDIRALVEERRKEYAGYAALTPPTHFLSLNGEPPLFQTAAAGNATELRGRGCTPGVVRGRARVMKEFAMPKARDFDILVARHTDPGWTPVIGISKGMIIEHGGMLSHASIVSRELGIPTVIGVQGATDIVKDGDLVELDGAAGTIKIVARG